MLRGNLVQKECVGPESKSETEKMLRKANGAPPKDVHELPGHSNVSTTMNVYAHAIREAKRTSARILDNVVNGN